MSRRHIRVAAAATAVLSAGALALPAEAVAAPQPSAHARACDKAAWEARVQGAPKGLSAGSRSGDYLWHDRRGFHLRVTHARHDQRVYSGVVTSSAPMRVERVKLEKGDTVKLSANRQSFAFVFTNHGYLDGVNFHTDCASAVAVSRLHIGNHDQRRTQVFLGRTRAHPRHIPFVVHRRHVKKASTS